MTDLVERLRACMSDSLEWEAADEIERRRAEIGHLREIIHAGVDEIERLRAALREIEDSSNDPRAVREARAALGGKP
jgi:predicted  nucleic acid-binding Zn-ribbon protein